MGEASILETSWSIALFGSFNPLIFHPDWLALQKVAGSDLLDDVTVVYESANLLAFTGDRLTLEVDFDRFLVQTAVGDGLELYGFVDRLFSVLKHTPIAEAACGHDVDFLPAAGDAYYDRFFNREAWSAEIGSVSAVSVTVRTDDLGTAIDGFVTVEQSAVQDGAVYASIVTEFAPDPTPVPSVGARRVVDGLDDVWARFREGANVVVANLLGMGTQ